MHMAHSIHADKTLAHLKIMKYGGDLFVCLFAPYVATESTHQNLCNKSSQKALIPNFHLSPSILPHARGAQGVEAAKHQRAVEEEHLSALTLWLF